MSHELVGVVKTVSTGKAIIALRNNLKIGDSIEFLSAGLGNSSYTVSELFDQNGNPVESGHNEEILIIPVQNGIRENDLIRRAL
jgi:putative protease